MLKVSSLGSTTTEEFEGEGGTIGSVTTDSDVRQSNEKSGKVKTFRLVLKFLYGPYDMVTYDTVIIWTQYHIDPISY